MDVTDQARALDYLERIGYYLEDLLARGFIDGSAPAPT